MAATLAMTDQTSGISGRKVQPNPARATAAMTPKSGSKRLRKSLVRKPKDRCTRI